MDDKKRTTKRGKKGSAHTVAYQRQTMNNGTHLPESAASPSFLKHLHSCLKMLTGNQPMLLSTIKTAIRWLSKIFEIPPSVCLWRSCVVDRSVGGVSDLAWRWWYLVSWVHRARLVCLLRSCACGGLVRPWGLFSPHCRSWCSDRTLLVRLRSPDSGPLSGLFSLKRAGSTSLSEGLLVLEHGVDCFVNCKVYSFIVCLPPSHLFP